MILGWFFFAIVLLSLLFVESKAIRLADPRREVVHLHDCQLRPNHSNRLI